MSTPPPNKLLTPPDQPSNAQQRFRAYLHRGSLCNGGRLTANWSLDGRFLIAPSDPGEAGSGSVSVDITTGAAAPLAGPHPPSSLRPPGLQPELWQRGTMVGEYPVPEVLSPDGQWFASVRDHNIVLRSTRDGRLQHVTSDGSSDRPWDIEALQGRILPGLEAEARLTTPWKPDSLALFGCRRDLAGVFRLPRIYWLNAFEEADYTPFPKAGSRIDRTQPCIIDVRSGVCRDIDVGELEDRYVQLLGWRPDGSEVLLIIYTRDYKQIDIVAADGISGKSRHILKESCSTFIKIQHDTLLAGAHGFTITPDNTGFLWLSTRDGYNHIYRYDFDGTLVGQLTEGNWPVHDIRHIGRDGFAYFTAATDLNRPYDVHVCRVPLAGGDVQTLTDVPGIHSPTFSPDGDAFLDVHSRFDRPFQSDLRRPDGTLLRTVARMDIAPLEAIGYVPPEEFVVKAADGVTDLWGVMYKPADFDPNSSYPVIEHIYGGPQIVATARQFSVSDRAARNIPWAIAQLGYIVVCLDARGTPGRSKMFQDTVYGAWGVNEIPDHAGAVRQLLARHSWMDGDRVGIMGHSWGAYYSTLALIQAPNLFKAAVSSSPGYDPWDSILYEPYLDLPSRNRPAYDHAALPNHASKLKGALLIASGTSEFSVIGSAMKMSRALIEENLQHELVILPGEYHAYVGAGEEYFIKKAIDWFEKHLGPNGGQL